MQGYWDPEIFVEVVRTVVVSVEEALEDIGMNAINVVINMEYDGEASWLSSLR